MNVRWNRPPRVIPNAFVLSHHGPGCMAEMSFDHLLRKYIRKVPCNNQQPTSAAPYCYASTQNIAVAFIRIIFSPASFFHLGQSQAAAASLFVISNKQRRGHNMHTTHFRPQHSGIVPMEVALGHVLHCAHSFLSVIKSCLSLCQPFVPRRRIPGINSRCPLRRISHRSILASVPI